MTTSTNKPKLKPLGHQLKAFSSLKEAIVACKNKLVVAPAGVGKTYVVLLALAEAYHDGLFKPDKAKLTPVIYLVPKAGVIKVRRLCIQLGISKFVTVENPDAFTRTDQYEDLERTKLIRQGSKYCDLLFHWFDDSVIWEKEEIPQLIIADECHMFRNPEAARSKLLCGYLEQGGFCIQVSATPFSKIEETQCLLIASGIASKQAFPHFCSTMLGWLEPNKPHPTITKQLNDRFEERSFLIRMRATYQHKAYIKAVLIDFETSEKRVAYSKMYDDYLLECAKQDKSTPSGFAAICVALLKFRQGAELLRADTLADLAYKRQVETNNQVIISSNFKETIRQVYVQLTRKGVAKQRICYIVGGQSAKDRQAQIDKWMKGDADYLVMTAKTGQACIDLDHEDGFPLSRPRYVLAPPVWSPLEIVQLLGRAYRTLTISDVYQDIIFYKETVEVQVADRMSKGQESLAQLIGRKESYADIWTKQAALDIDKLKAFVEKETANTDTETDELETDELDIDDLSANVSVA